MSGNADIKLYFKGIAGSLLSALASVLGILAVGFFKDYFEAHPLYAPITLGSLGIDVLGAVTPLIAGLTCGLLFIRFMGYPIKKLVSALAVSILFAFLLCHPTDEGITGYPLLFSLVAIIAAASVNIYPKLSVNLRKGLLSTLSLTLFCIPLSLLMVDLWYLPFFAQPVIGGNGLSDGILISMFYAILA